MIVDGGGGSKTVETSAALILVAAEPSYDETEEREESGVSQHVT